MGLTPTLAGKTTIKTKGRLMKTFGLIAAVLVVPAVWGYLAHLLMQRIWPQPTRSLVRDRPEGDEPRNPPSDIIDFQI